ncbi:hypothetical protein ACQWKN_22100 [Salmonella enterica subsp. enterica serovar Infantis]
MNNVSWRFPEATGRDVERALQLLVRDLVVRMRRNTKRLKFDDQVSEAAADNESYAEELISAFIALLPTFALSIYKFNSKEFIRIANKTGGKNNLAVMLLIGRGANAGESWYAPKYHIWRQMVRDSIRKMVDNILDDWEMQVRLEELHEADQKRLNAIIERRFKVYKNWASRRTSGIVGAWNSVLMYQRCVDAGVTHYIWRGQLDDREREKHLMWEKKRIALTSNHVFPGEEFNCRCWAQPDWETAE